MEGKRPIFDLEKCERPDVAHECNARSTKVALRQGWLTQLAPDIRVGRRQPTHERNAVYIGDSKDGEKRSENGHAW